MKKIILTLLFTFCLLINIAQAKELYLFNWSEYIPDEVLEQFTKETGIKVYLSTYDSNEAMYTKIKLVKGEYDLIVPSTYFVEKMAREGLLEPINHKLIPNLKNISPKFLNQSFDPENKYSVPYMWGSTAVCYNSARLGKGYIKSLNDLWNPELKGKLLLPNDVREVFGLALKKLGYSINETNPKHIEEAYLELKKLIPLVKVFDSDSPKHALLNEEVLVAVTWSGEAFIANSEDQNFLYAYPKEGYSLWMDSFAIPRGAKNVENAHKFMNFILRPDISAKISQEMGYATPNQAAIKLLPPEIQNNPIIYPSQEELKRGEFQTDVQDALLVYEKYWNELKNN